MADNRAGRNGRRAALLVAAAVGLAGGCASSPVERPLSAQLFLPPAGAATPAAVPTTEPATAADERLASPAREVVTPTDATVPRAIILPPVPAPEFADVRPLDPLMPTTAPATAEPGPTTEPTAGPTAAVPPPKPVTGVYMTVGGVVARVNDTPIYAHTVLALLDKELAGRARELRYREDFQDLALSRIIDTTEELIEDERLYQVASKRLSADDMKHMTALSEQERKRAVDQAGGSVELAGVRAAAEGDDFDDRMKREHRHRVIEYFEYQQIDQMIHVSPQDMRDEYAAHGAKLYGDKDAMRFRVIKIDPDRVRDAPLSPRVTALAHARSVHDRAVAGADFEAMARAENDDEFLKSVGGDPGGPIDRGAYVVEPVEQALWALAPGGVTDPVEVDRSFYVAKLEAKHVASVKPFEDPAVQADLYNRLAEAQHHKLTEQLRATTAAECVLSVPDPRFTVAVQMAMEKYAKWTAEPDR